MALLVPGLLLVVTGLLAALAVFRHAFGRSVGTGLMVVCIPGYNLYYAFSQFEHPRKGLVVGAYLGCLTLGIWLSSVGAALR